MNIHWDDKGDGFVDASDLDWPVGHWPMNFTLKVKDDDVNFRRSSLHESHATYDSVNGLRLTVTND
jgi:hypothetical protein